MQSTSPFNQHQLQLNLIVATHMLNPFSNPPLQLVPVVLLAAAANCGQAVFATVECCLRVLHLSAASNV